MPPGPFPDTDLEVLHARTAALLDQAARAKKLVAREGADARQVSVVAQLRDEAAVAAAELGRQLVTRRPQRGSAV